MCYEIVAFYFSVVMRKLVLAMPFSYVHNFSYDATAPMLVEYYK